MAQGLQLMRKNAGVGKLLASAALREHHRILDEAIKLEDWSKAESLFVQASTFPSQVLWPLQPWSCTVQIDRHSNSVSACRGLQRLAEYLAPVKHWFHPCCCM